MLCLCRFTLCDVAHKTQYAYGTAVVYLQQCGWSTLLVGSSCLIPHLLPNHVQGGTAWLTVPCW
jgi:hypothetical protein